MKKIIITLAGVMATIVMITGCGSNKKSDKKADVDVDVGIVQLNDGKGSYATEYIYRSEDKSAARKLCEENMYEFLDDGETVSEMIETSDDNGDTIYYFRVIHIVAG